MQALNLPAGRGWRWLSEGFALLRRKQLLLSLVVLAYWMTMAVISAVPIVGRVLAMLFIPAFSVSLMNACRFLEGGNAPPLLIFSGFRQNLRGLLELGAIYVALMAAIFGLVAVVDGGALFNLVFLGQVPDEAAMASDEMRLAGQLALALLTPLMMAYWFAPVLAAWHGVSPGKALFFSFVACVRNWRAFLVYCATVIVFGALLPGLLVGVASSLVPGADELFSLILSLALFLILLPTLYVSFYVSYRDVFVSNDEDA